MAVPKKKTSPHRRGNRRSHHRLSVDLQHPCASCGALKFPHHVCSSCHMYKGRFYGKNSQKQEVKTVGKEESA